jgi:hypothetical protein
MENKEYQIPNTYPKPKTNQVELVTINFGNALVKPLLYEKAFGDTSQFLGRQILTSVKLKVKDYQDERFNLNTNRYEKITVAGSEITLDTVLVEISASKNIIQTAINGVSGTVKEYISNGDYEITFSGALVSSGKGYPFEMVQTLQDIMKAPVAIEVESELLSLFNIFNIVVKSSSFPSREGYTNTQLFSFSALSDEPVELKL